MQKTLRVKLVCIDPVSLFHTFIRTNTFFTEQGIPEDAQLLNTGFDLSRRQIVMVISHPSFDEIPIGEVPPELPVVIKTMYAEKN